MKGGDAYLAQIYDHSVDDGGKSKVTVKVEESTNGV